MKSGHITKLAFVTVLFWHCLISARAESRPVLSSNVNQDAYVTVLADADQALQAGKRTEAAHKYAAAARLLPVHSDTALKAAGLLAAVNEYLDAAEMAALGKEATKIAEERKAATQLLEQLKPHFQIDVDLQFFRALREVPTGGLAAAGATMEKISRLVNDPLEGRLTLAFMDIELGKTKEGIGILKEWLATNPRTPDMILHIRLASFYEPDLVSRAIEDNSVNALLTAAFDSRAINRVTKAIDKRILAEEPPCRTVNPRDGATMLLIPGGEFKMGDPSTPDNLRHVVNLSSYWIYEKPVTVAQYRKFCDATERSMPPEPHMSDHDFNPKWKKTNHPIVDVSWDDAVAYCKWAGGRLPTEAEWEKAARGVEALKYPWGNAYNPALLQCSKVDGDSGGTAPVGSFPDGASPFGTLDMEGNVQQWCSDFYAFSYWRHAPVNDPQGPQQGKERVAKGGSWYDDDFDDFYSYRRSKYEPGVHFATIGIRCALGIH